MGYIVTIEAEYDTARQAKNAMSDLEEVVGKTNGDLLDSTIEDEEGEQIQS